MRPLLPLPLCLLVAITAACGGPATPPAATVAGVVIGFSDQGVADLVVQVGGAEPVTTGEDGSFAVPDVSVPYAATVIDDQGSQGPMAVVYEGLTSMSPTLRIANLDGFARAEVSGRVSGGAGWPQPPTHETRVFAGVRGSLSSERDTTEDLDGAFSLPGIAWFHDGPATARLHAIQYAKDADGLPTTFTGYGTLSVQLQDGDMLSGQDFSMGSVPTTTLSGMVNAPAGSFFGPRMVFLRPPEGSFFGLPRGQMGSPSFTLQAPVVPDLRLGIMQLVAPPSLDGGVVLIRQNLPEAADVTLDMPGHTSIELPGDGISGVTYETRFQVTPPRSDRVYSFAFTPVAVGAPRIRVFTTAETITIPDLSSLGLGLPSATEYEWTMTAVGPASSVDEVSRLVSSVGLPPLDVDEMFLAESRERTFTTAP